MTATQHFSVERVTPKYWRVTFDHGPINTITEARSTTNKAQERAHRGRVAGY